MEKDNEGISINFAEFLRCIRRDKWFAIVFTMTFALIGTIYAFFAREEFVAEGKILPELQSKTGGLGQFAGLAALAGVDLASMTAGSDAVRVDLYPDVLKSTPYFLTLLNHDVIQGNNKVVKFDSFYNQEVLDGDIKKKDLIQKFRKSSEYITFNKLTENKIKDLKERIICIFDKKSGIISISVKLPDPVVAAQIANFSMTYLTDYIINYRTEKLKIDLTFIEERLANAKGRFYNNQSKKASYGDQVPLNAIRQQSADLQRERIEAEYKISSSFYNTLLQKYEEAKLKVQQETPVIKVLEPPVVPNLKSEPKRIIIITLSTLLGLLFSICFIVFRKGNFRNIIS